MVWRLNGTTLRLKSFLLLDVCVSKSLLTGYRTGFHCVAIFLLWLPAGVPPVTLKKLQFPELTARTY